MGQGARAVNPEYNSGGCGDLGRLYERGGRWGEGGIKADFENSEQAGGCPRSRAA